MVATVGTVVAVNGGEPEPSGWPDIDIGSIEDFQDVGVGHPGGYGAWYVEDGVVYVYMNDRGADPEAAFEEMYEGDPLDLPVRAVSSTYSYQELDNWRRHINEVNREDVLLSHEGIRIDVGRIQYGVLTIEEIEPTIEWIAAQGVPRTAFEVHLDLARPDFRRNN